MSGVKGRSGGHNRKTLEQLKRTGSFRPGRHAKLTKAQAPAPMAAIEKPPYLSTGGAAVWDYLAPVAVRLGTLTASDATAFGTLCELQATLQTIAKDKDTLPGASIQSEKAYATIALRYYGQFGLTPTDRARLAVPANEEPDDFTEFDHKWLPPFRKAEAQ